MSVRRQAADGKVKISVRLLPSTVQHLRDATQSAGFADQISLYAQKLLEEFLPVVRKWKTVHGMPSWEVRSERKTQTLTVSPVLLSSYSLESLRLHMVRRTDLLEAVLIIALGQKSEVINRRRSMSMTAELADDGRSMTIDEKASKSGKK